jgi:hypothetical protein
MLTAPITAPFSIPALGRFQLPPRFAPTAHASLSGALTLGSPALKHPISIFMSGRGVAPILRVTPSSLNFSPTAVGFTSNYLQLEVSNVGDDWLEGSWEMEDALRQFGFGPYYFPEDVYPFELYPGESFQFYLTFTAAHEGPAIGNLKILSDDDLLPRVDVPLTALGTPPEPRISIYYTYEDPIRTAPIGGEGSSQILIDNPGSAPLEIFSVTSSNPLFTTSLSPNPIQPKGRGTLTVTYHPIAWGLETTTLTISHNDPTTPPVTRSIGGRAFEPPPVAQVTPTTLDFGSLLPGASGTLSFEIRNLGAGPLFLTGYTPLLSSYCADQTDLTVPATILPGEALTAHVTYEADTSKSTCDFYFYTNDPAKSVVTIQILATILVPRIALGSYVVEFPITPTGGSSTSPLIAYNFGAGPLIISSAYFDNPAFSLATPLPLTIPTGGEAELGFVFSPTNESYVDSGVTLVTNDPAYPQVNLYLYGYAFSASSARAKESFR